jgi:beta-lactamase regulating signal transducer with metallopeptidase domain/thiol-disulfide isomerase/thioredoxin
MLSHMAMIFLSRNELQTLRILWEKIRRRISRMDPPEPARAVPSPSPPHTCGGEGRGEEVPFSIHVHGEGITKSKREIKMNLPLSFASPVMVILFKWTCLLALGWVVHGLLRRHHAGWRLILWRGILCFGLLLPLLHFFQIPGLKIPIASDAVFPTESASSLSPVAAVNPRQPPVSTSQPPRTPVAASPTSMSANSLPASPTPKRVSWENILLLIWALGCVCGVFRLLRLQLQLSRLRKDACRPSPEHQRLAAQMLVRLNVRRQVEVHISDAVASPFVCGLARPAIILPRMLAQELSPGELAALLSHEIAHVRQHDLVWCVAWRWMKAVCWFHPLVWKVPAVHNLACEQEADRVASGQLPDRDSYAQLLARLALRVLALPAVETELTLNGSSQIARRIIHLGQKSRRSWTWKHSVAGFGLVGSLFLMTAGCDFSKTAAARSKTPKPVEFKELLVVVQDQGGKPIEGAAIQPTGFRVKGVRWQDALGWNQERFGPPVKATTDGEGKAFVKYPVEGLPEEHDLTGILFLAVSHPEFAPAQPEYSVDSPGKPIQLTRGIHLEISGYFGGDHQPVPEFVPNLSEDGLRAEDWQKKENGVLACHKLSAGGHLLQLMGRLPSGEIVYSEAFAFTAEKGQEYKFALEMKPGIRLEGRLDDRVPRPVKNGRVLISVRPKETPASTVSEAGGELVRKYGYFDCWKSYRPIAEDGSFVFESIPRGEVDVVVQGDGFISKSIGQVKYRIPLGQRALADGPPIGIPQPFALVDPITKIEVVTEPAATLELTAKTKRGKPVVGAGVYLYPNVVRMGGIFGEMKHSSEEPFRTPAPLPKLYSATTDINGMAVIRNVPAAISQFMELNHPQFQIPLQHDERHRFVHLQLSPGETNKIELTLEPKDKDSTEAVQGVSSPPDSPHAKTASVKDILDKAASHQGLTGEDDPALRKLGDALVHFIRQRDARVFKDEAYVTSDLIWALVQQSGQKGASRQELDDELKLQSQDQMEAVRSAVQQMEDAGIDLKNADIQIQETSVERLQHPGPPGSLAGMIGEQFQLKLAVNTKGKSKNGTSLSGDYILAASQIMRFADDWKVVANFRWSQLPAGVLDQKAAAKMDFENYAAAHGTLPPQTTVPEIEFTTLDGDKKMKLSDLRGKVVVLDFWATWCGPCQEPMAQLQTLRQTHPDWQDKVAIVPLSIDDTLDVVRHHVDQRGWTNTFNVWAEGGGWHSKPALAFQVRGVPTTYIIDANGKIARAGHPDTMDIGQEVDDLLKL